MDAERLRREIAHQAAQLLYRKQENSFVKARWRAARSITRRYLPTAALPTDFEIRQALDQVMGEIPAISESVSTTHKRDRLLGLLLPLDRVRWKSPDHPEDDVLFHCLQVFELARDRCVWDRELHAAALLHDVGQAIDREQPIDAAVAMLQDLVPPRTLELIQQLELATLVFRGQAGARATRRIRQCEDAETLEMLAECDQQGRIPGRPVCTPEEAVDWILEDDDTD